MASRYWVGGNGNWSDATNHWSDSSGGAPGAGFLPTSADNVYFDANSLSAISIVTFTSNGECLDFDLSGLTYRLTFTASVTIRQFNIYGNVINHATLSVLPIFSNALRMNLVATSTKTITSNGGLMGSINFNGIGGKWILQDAFSGDYITLTNGELDTNEFDVVLSSQLYTASGTKALILYSNSFTARSWSNAYPNGFTFTYSTSTVILNAINSSVNGGNTFYNLSLLGVNDYSAEVNFNANIVVLNSLIIQGFNATNRRLFLKSSIDLTQRTITASNVYVENADFMDIKGAGSGDWDLSSILGGSGDAGGNSDIIFTSPITCYWHVGSGLFSDAQWYSETNGGGSAVRVPFPQDTAIFDENSFDSSGSITLDCKRIGKHFIMTNVNQAVSLVYVTPNTTFFGDFLINSLITPSTNLSLINFSRSNFSLNLANKTIYSLGARLRMDITCNLLAGFTCTSELQVFCGLDTNDHPITVQMLSFQSSLSVKYLKNSLITITGISGTVFSFASGTNIDQGTSTIYFNPASGNNDISMSIWSRSWYNFRFGGQHTGRFLIQYSTTLANPDYSGGHSYFNNITIDAGRKVRWYIDAITSVNSFTAIGTAVNPINISSQITQTIIGQHFLRNLSTSDIIVEYCDISYCNVSGTTKIKTFIGKTWSSISKAAGIAKASIKRIMGVYVNSVWIANNSNDSGNNTGWNFE